MHDDFLLRRRQAGKKSSVTCVMMSCLQQEFHTITYIIIDQKHQRTHNNKHLYTSSASMKATIVLLYILLLLLANLEHGAGSRIRVVKKTKLDAEADRSLQSKSKSKKAGSRGDEDCPEGFVYQECGTACPFSCDSPATMLRPCTMQCVQGCFCAEGTVLDQDDGTMCIPPDECPT